MIEKKQKGWQPGQSGNPKGKTPGSGALQKLRAIIAADVPEILAGLVIAAKGGDTAAARLLLERVIPPMRAVELAVELRLPHDGTLTAKATAVLSAAAAGEIAPTQAAQLISALGTLAKINEVDELAARITLLEHKHAST